MPPEAERAAGASAASAWGGTPSTQASERQAWLDNHEQLLTNALHRASPRPSPAVRRVLVAQLARLEVLRNADSLRATARAENLHGRETAAAGAEEAAGAPSIGASTSLDHTRADLTPALVAQDDGAAGVTQGEQESAAGHRAIVFSFCVNVVLLVMKIVAVVASGALVLYTSAADSVLDLVSGGILFFASRAQRRFDPQGYPIGRTPLEAVGIVSFSTLMGAVSLQLIVESVQALVNGFNGEPNRIRFPPIVLGVLLGVMGAKMIALFVCWRVRHISSGAAALVQDHRNDIMTNGLSLAATYLAAEVGGAWWVDPAAAAAFSLYLLIGWLHTGGEQVQILSGKAADPEVIAALTWVAMTHHPAIRLVDTVRAYHVGAGVQAEVDIVLPPEMPLRESHDIAESLTLALETAVKEVERAFVHLDYESTHSPLHEHKNDALRENQKRKKSKAMKLRHDQLSAPLLGESAANSSVTETPVDSPTVAAANLESILSVDAAIGSAAAARGAAGGIRLAPSTAFDSPSTTSTI